MKVIIIEDEQLNAAHLQSMLQKIDSNIEVVAVIESVKQAISLLNNGLTADLIFLDVHLADGKSFEIFEHVQLDTPIIFTTAYDEYALKAFQVNSIDYLLKPIAVAELNNALQKMKRISATAATSPYHLLNEQISTQEHKSRFLVKSGKYIDSIPVEEVHHFVTTNSISFLVHASGKKYAVDYTLEQLEALLHPTTFFRINRKAIMNLAYVKKVSTFFNSRLSIESDLMDGEVSIVSRERVAEFKKWLDA